MNPAVLSILKNVMVIKNSHENEDLWTWGFFHLFEEGLILPTQEVYCRYKSSYESDH